MLLGFATLGVFILVCIVTCVIRSFSKGDEWLLPTTIIATTVIFYLVGLVTDDIGYAISASFYLWLGAMFLLPMLIKLFNGGPLVPQPEPPIDDTFGSARFGTGKDAERKGHTQALDEKSAGKFFIGRFASGKDFFAEGHQLTCAKTGAGKGVSLIIPNLLRYPGSVVAVDIKGELSAVTGRARREMGQDVYCLDPFGVTDNDSCAINPLDWIDVNNKDCGKYADRLAEMFIMRDDKSESYWDNAAKQLLSGLILYIATLPDEQRHLGTVRDILFSGEDVRDKHLVTMATNKSPLLKKMLRAANAFLSKAEREQSGVIGSLNNHTAFLDNDEIVETLTTSGDKLNCDIRQLKKRLMSLYMVMSPDDIFENARYLRIMLGSAINAVLADNDRPVGGSNVAFFIDELFQLGYMKPIEKNVSLVRGFGGSFWLVIQNLQQLEGLYPDQWQTFLANTTKQIFGVGDFETAEHISKSLGKYTRTFFVESGGTSSGTSRADTKFLGSRQAGSSSGYTQQKIARDLLSPDEIQNLDDDKLICLVPGEHPYILFKENYLNDDRYGGLYDDNPQHPTTTIADSDGGSVAAGTGG